MFPRVALSSNNSEEPQGIEEEDIETQPVAPMTLSAHLAQKAPLPFWKEVYKDWQSIKNDIICQYNQKLYGTDELEPFPFELQSQTDRDRWMALFAIGAAYSLGRTKIEQHAGFVRWCKRKGYWQIFVAPEIVAEEWIKVIDQHIEQNDSEYNHWMRLYPEAYKEKTHCFVCSHSSNPRGL